jgi:hypothetical protein
MEAISLGASLGSRVPYKKRFWLISSTPRIGLILRSHSQDLICIASPDYVYSNNPDNNRKEPRSLALLFVDFAANQNN